MLFRTLFLARAIKRECYGCHVKELESARVTDDDGLNDCDDDDIPGIRRGLSLGRVSIS